MLGSSNSAPRNVKRSFSVASLEVAVQEQELDPANGDVDLGLVHEGVVDRHGGLGREGKGSDPLR